MSEIAYLESLMSTLPGNVFYVDDAVGSNANDGRTRNHPVASIDFAIGLCAASNGDVIYVAPNYTETLTSSITMDVIGVSVIGLGSGSTRPQLFTETAIDVITITAANCKVQNIDFIAPGVDVVTADINIAAAGCEVINCTFHGSATSFNKVAMITTTSAADDCLIHDCRFYNEVVECPSAIEIENASDRMEISHCQITCNDTVGYGTGAIIDGAAACKQLVIHHCDLRNMVSGQPVVDMGVSNSIGSMWACTLAGRDTTMADNVLPGSGEFAVTDTLVVEEAALNGIRGAPVVDS